MKSTGMVRVILDFFFCLLGVLKNPLTFLIFPVYCNALSQYGKASAENRGPLVNTSAGAIAGKYVKVFDTEIASFQGIPFAKPPKRFQKPEPIGSWDGVLKAENKAPACMQYSDRSYIWFTQGLNKSEDCLYLNIWTPADLNDAEEPLPVLVWIFGGGYFVGASGVPIYDGAIMAARGDIVVVSINYRVGAFGFFNGGIKEAPGNVALLDQLLGLKWVKKNIQYFGGDPDKITLAGWSAGSMSVGFHQVSPMSRGLFRGSIMQSGSQISPILREGANESISRSNSFAEKAGCSSKMVNLRNRPLDVVKCLKEMDPLELAKVENIFTLNSPIYFRPYFGPNRCEGCNPFLPDSFHELQENSSQVPTILGNVKEETNALFLNYMFPDRFPVDKQPNITLQEAKELLSKLFSVEPKVSVNDTYDFYFGKLTDTENAAVLIETLANTISDFYFNCPSLYHAERSDKAYLYWMTHRSAIAPNAEWVGVQHVTDVFYGFGRPFVKVEDFTDEDRKFSKQIINQWTTFVKDLRPSGNSGWEQFNSSHPMAYELNPEKDEMIPFPRKEACEFWRFITFNE